jgi:2'-5' RNA ligase
VDIDPATLRPGNRLFVAGVLPDEARDLLARTGAALAARHGGRPVPAANLHLTMDFLGNVPASAWPAVAGAVAEAVAGPPIAVAVGGLRARPRAARASLVAVELVDREGALADRAARLRSALDAVLGRPAQPGPLWPHVTVLRLRPPARVRPSEPVGREHLFDISRAALYDSHQSPGGPPQYREVAAVELAPVP